MQNLWKCDFCKTLFGTVKGAERYEDKCIKNLVDSDDRFLNAFLDKIGRHKLLDLVLFEELPDGTFHQIKEMDQTGEAPFKRLLKERV